MLRQIFDFLQNHQKGDRLQKAGEIPAVSFAVSAERVLTAGCLSDAAAVRARPARAVRAGG